MMNEAATPAIRPLPQITPLSAPFWSAARARQLVIQRCGACGSYRFPPEIGCFNCGSLDSAWTPVSGRASLYTWTVAHPPLLPYFLERAPWPVAVVELDEGPRLVTTLVGLPAESYRHGMRLKVDFEDVDAEITLVVFRRDDGSEP
jgi:hypothetical protein